MLSRILETEVMDTPAEALDYDAMDHSAVNRVFVDDLLAAIAAIPEPFASQLGSVAIVVEDEAGPDQLASVGARGLFGLYQGVPRTRWGADGAPVPSKITIFRGPLERGGLPRAGPRTAHPAPPFLWSRLWRGAVAGRGGDPGRAPQRLRP